MRGNLKEDDSGRVVGPDKYHFNILLLRTYIDNGGLLLLFQSFVFREVCSNCVKTNFLSMSDWL